MTRTTTTSAKNAGRIIGVLLLAQGVIGFVVNFVLMRPVLVAAGFLANAAANSFEITLAVLLLFVAAALSIGVAITAFPVFRQYSHAMALWLFALSVVGLSLAAVENATVLSMRSLSEQYARAGGQDELFQALRPVVGAARNWAHYTNLVVGGGMLFVLYGVLFRFALVPRALAGFGLVAAVLQITAIVRPLFGYPIVFLMLMPVGLSQLALTLWLMAKGFAERHHAVRPEAHEGELARA